MPYQGDPANNLVDQIRVRVGDTFSDIEMLDDNTYIWLLTQYNNNAKRCVPDACSMIMFRLTRWTREKAGDIEVYGSDWAKSYLAALKEIMRNPNLYISVIVPYAGGIDGIDAYTNDINPNNLRPSIFVQYNNVDRGPFQVIPDRELFDFYPGIAYAGI